MECTDHSIGVGYCVKSKFWSDYCSSGMPFQSFEVYLVGMRSVFKCHPSEKKAF